MTRKPSRTRIVLSQRRTSVRRRLLMERLGDRRVLAALTGVVFDDTNESLVQDLGESGLEFRVAYLDHNENGALDADEPYELTDSVGGFTFAEVADGLAIVRVFDGNSSQRQTFPVVAETTHPVVEAAGVQTFFADDDGAIALTGDAVISANLESGLTTSIENFSSLTSAQRLSDGRLIVIGTSESGDTAWVVDSDLSNSTAIDLSGSASGAAWSSLVLGSDGRGLVLESSDSPTTVRSIDASDPSNIVTGETTTVVAANSVAIGSSSGNRSVIASPDPEGLVLNLWSNSTATLISANDVVVPGISELLAFDDATGLLAARTIDGGVSVLDVEASFAELQRIDDVDGPVAIDPMRELLFSISPNDNSLVLRSLSQGNVLATYPLAIPELGSITSVALGSNQQSVVVIGTLGLREISLSRPGSHRVMIVDGNDPAPMSFGLVSTADNSPPSYASIPSFEVLEDDVLNATAPGALAGATDSESDPLLVLQQGEAANGQLSIRPNGSLLYMPNIDFNGTETINVRLSDGRSLSEPISLEIQVIPVPDAPSQVTIVLNPVPESLPIGEPVATLLIEDPDLVDNHLTTIDDPRFQWIGNQLINVAGVFDYESEPTIPLRVTVTDPETGTEIVKNTTLNLLDANDPITGIVPNELSVFENVPGELLAGLEVLDEDAEQSHTLTVDDERFVIDGFDLRLADGVSLDFETEQIVTINVTATEIGADGTFTQAIVIRVKDIPEQPQTLGLSNQTVEEKKPGAIVGDVLVDGRIADSRYSLSVDDPRFEVSGTQLKLVDGVSVDVATQSEIELEITATDSQGQFAAISGSFVITVLKQDIPFHNDELPEDVDGSGDVTAGDALEIIHYLNQFGPGPVGQGNPNIGFDVNGDGFITALDALIVINYLNRIEVGGGGGTVGGEPEPEQMATTPSAPDRSQVTTPENTRDEAIVQWNQSTRDASDTPPSTPNAASRLLQSDVMSKPSDDESVVAAVDAFVRLLGDA